MIKASKGIRKGFRNQKQHIDRLAPPLCLTDKQIDI